MYKHILIRYNSRCIEVNKKQLIIVDTDALLEGCSVTGRIPTLD